MPEPTNNTDPEASGSAPPAVSQELRRWSIPPPNLGVLRLRTDARLLVAEQDGEPRWQLGIGWEGVRPVTTVPGHLALVDIDAVVQLVASQLVRMVDIANRVGVPIGTVATWRLRNKRFPAPVAPGPLWWWPHLVAAGFDRPQSRPRRDRTRAAETLEPWGERPLITEEELAALFQACADDPRPHGRRDTAWLALLCTGGLLRTEALEVDLGDYDPATGTLQVAHGTRTVALDDAGRAALDAWLAVRGQQREPDRDGRHPLFVAINNKGGRVSRRRLSVARVNQILDERALQGHMAHLTAAHDLRRALGGNLLHADVDLSTMTRPERPSGWPPSPGVLRLRTDGRVLVVEQAGEPGWLVGIGETGLRPVTTDPGHLQPVDMETVVQLVSSQLVRMVDIAEQAGVNRQTVADWRDRYRDDFPAPVAPGPLWWWPHLVAAGFDRPQPWGRLSRTPPIEEDLEALLPVCAADPRVHGRRDAALLAVLHAGRLGYAEVVDADLDDYKAATGTLRVTRGSGHPQLVHLDGSGRAALTAWLKIRLRLWEPDTDDRHPLFVSFSGDGLLSPWRLTVPGVNRILAERAHQARRLASGGQSMAVADVQEAAELQGAAGHQRPR